jgi:hypothetical protein
LGLARRQRGRHHGTGGVGVVGVHQHETSGMLGLGRPHQAPHRRSGQVVAADRAPGYERQAGGVVLGQPLLDALQYRCSRQVNTIDHTTSSDHWYHHDIGVTSFPNRDHTGDRRPFQGEQRVMGGSQWTG